MDMLPAVALAVAIAERSSVLGRAPILAGVIARLVLALEALETSDRLLVFCKAPATVVLAETIDSTLVELVRAVAFPLLVTSPVRLALVVTVAALPLILPEMVLLKVLVPPIVWLPAVVTIVLPLLVSTVGLVAVPLISPAT
jgi:hypothetical protein